MGNKSTQGIRFKELSLSLALSMSLSLPAFADDITVKQLIGWCNGQDPHFKEPFPQLMCSSWIGGFLSAVIFADGIKTLEGEQKSDRICAPGGNVDKITQLQDALVMLSKESPDLQDATARAVLYSVIRNMYACKK